MPTAKEIKKNTQLFKALAHPIRLQIVETLLEGEKCVCAMQDLLHVSQPNISQHLSILKYADVVDCQQRGNQRCYYLADPEKIEALLKSLT
jgi:ArsR family transcriptional regulator